MYISECIITVNHVIYMHSSIYPCLLFLSMTQFLCHQAFNQALLSTSAFPQRLSFFTVYLVQQPPGVTPWWKLKGNFLEFRSADCCKMHFSWTFKSFIGSSEEKLTRRIHTNFLYMYKQRVRRIGE